VGNISVQESMLRSFARARTLGHAVILATMCSAAATRAALVAQTLPSKLADSTFWRLVSDYSESNGYFRSDNFVSNETTLQWVIPELQRTTRTGGVYLGVGPDQNFTYIVALKPKIAFIFDIRRQNMLTHLMYKALIEQSTDRADFISRLFARPRPSGLDTASSPEAIFAAFANVPADSARARRTVASIRDALVRRHGFPLSDEDLGTIAYVYESFVSAGPDISYNTSSNGRGGSYGGYGGYGRSMMPSFAVLQMETDSDRVHRSYMATEANFRTLKEVELNNLLVPIVGDFAGPKAIRAVGAFLREHKASVTAFYLSNVEQYLFQDPDNWKRFYTNAGLLPLDSSSTFIRSVFNGMSYGRASNSGAMYMRSQQMLASMLEQVRAFNDGRLTQYYDVIQTSR
jgi:hypothetical protein